MCGISGVINSSDVARTLFLSIRNLEYRGYDSCGMALLDNGTLRSRKNTGGPHEVNLQESLTEMSGNIGIAHTRWATHGKVNRENSHPHLSQDQNFAVVHNGIISNYQKLRNEFLEEGYNFSSETDSEVFAALLEKKYADTLDVEESFLAAISEIEGSFALAMLSTHAPEHLFCAKRHSPLIIGLGEGSNYVGSDINAFLEYTRKAIVLDEDEYVKIGKESYEIRNISTRLSEQKPIMVIDWDAETIKKGGYPHYMIKEIFDEPHTIQQTLKIPREQFQKLAQSLIQARQAYLLGVGTTFYVASAAQYYFSMLTQRYMPAISSDEFNEVAIVTAQDALLTISQSGETYDSKLAIKYAQDQGASTAAVVNVMGSSISMMVDQVIMQASGPEICVVSTKAALAQTLILLQIALEAALLEKKLTPGAYEEHYVALNAFPELLQNTLNEQSGFIRNMARSISHVKQWLFLGCGIYYPVAMESALKMKEVTYQHAEGMSAGFLKHGTLSMIEENFHTLFFVPPPEEVSLHNRTLIAIEEVKTRGGTVIGFCFQNDTRAIELLHQAVVLPTVNTLLAPVFQMAMAQLFAYYAALDLGRNIDKPRNLAKSVTVG